MLRNKQYGIGLLELMLSLAIIAVLLVMATRYYLTASVSSKINSAINAVGGLDGAIERWQQNHAGDLSTLNLTQCVTNGWIPSNLVDNGGNLVTPWGGAPIDTTTNKNDVTISITPGTDQEAINFCYRLCSKQQNQTGTMCDSLKGGQAITYRVLAQTCSFTQ